MSEPPAIVEIPSGVFGTSEREAHDNVNMSQGANLSRRGKFDHAVHDGVVAVMEGLHEDGSTVCLDVTNSSRLCGCAGRGLLAQHMLACCHGFDIPRSVKAVRERVIDDLNLRVINHGLIILEYSRDSVSGGIGLSFRCVSCSDRYEMVSGVGGRSKESVRGNA
jgi:hypothetical protein